MFILFGLGLGLASTSYTFEFVNGSFCDKGYIFSFLFLLKIKKIIVRTLTLCLVLKSDN